MTSSNDDFDDVQEQDGDGEFMVDGEFDVAETYYPYAPPQQWVVLGDFTADELAVYTVVMAHLNPHTGKFVAHFGRKRLQERFGRSLDWVDKQLKGLDAKGAMSKRATYWLDPKDHSRGRTFKRYTPEGVKRAQAPNQYRVHLAPPGGATYPGPIKISEFYKPSKITRRIMAATGESAGEGGAASQRPGSDQGVSGEAPQPPEQHCADQVEQANPQVKGGPLHSGYPQPPASGPRGPLHSGPKDHGSPEEEDGGQAPLSPPTGDMPGKPGVPPSVEPEPDSTTVPTTDPGLGDQPTTARARRKAPAPARPRRVVRPGGLGGSTTAKRFARQVREMPDLQVPAGVKAEDWRTAAGKLYRARLAAGSLAAEAVRENPDLPVAQVERLVAEGGIEGQDPGEVVERAQTLVSLQRALEVLRHAPDAVGVEIVAVPEAPGFATAMQVPDVVLSAAWRQVDVLAGRVSP